VNEHLNSAVLLAALQRIANSSNYTNATNLRMWADTAIREARQPVVSPVVSDTDLVGNEYYVVHNERHSTVEEYTNRESMVRDLEREIDNNSCGCTSDDFAVYIVRRRLEVETKQVVSFS
jgi:hypothetical protein